MEICINGKKADITLESEKTVEDLLAGLDSWLAQGELQDRPDSSGMTHYRLSGLIIDGKAEDAQSLENTFGRELSTIKTLNIIVSRLHELICTALRNTQEELETWKNLDFSAKQSFAENWKTGPAAALLREQYPPVYDMTLLTFSGEGPGAQFFAALLDERLRELENPSEELDRMEQLINDVTGRLENLPLDIQTGKDKQAAETIQIFTGLTEKIFRIFTILKADGFPVAQLKVANPAPVQSVCENGTPGRTEIPIMDFLDEFNITLKEMLGAYEQKDAVLVGDLAEYEMAPRLRNFYAALKKPAVA